MLCFFLLAIFGAPHSGGAFTSRVLYQTDVSGLLRRVEVFGPKAASIGRIGLFVLLDLLGAANRGFGEIPCGNKPADSLGTSHPQYA